PAARAAGDCVARDLPVPLDVERPDRRADVWPEHAADHGLDLRTAARVRHVDRRDRAGVVHLTRHPARGVLRVPAVLRPGSAGGLGEVAMRGPRCAVVGSGLAALAAYATLRRGGLEPEEIVVLGTHADPTAVWGGRARSIRQRRMRSESEGHLGAASFPGLSVYEWMRTGSLRPLVASFANRYHPTVEEFIGHAQWVRERSGWDRSFVERRVQRIRAVDGGFELDGDAVAPHVLVATGHPGLLR